jgi:hypothetical protein
VLLTLAAHSLDASATKFLASGEAMERNQWPKYLTAYVGEHEKFCDELENLPPQHCETMVLYRGVSTAGRVKGFSWTKSLDIACWFALRKRKPNPAVYRTITSEILSKIDGSEDEFLIKPGIVRRMRISVEEMKRLAKKHQRRMNSWSMEDKAA